jgi:D-serine deaminase-like pyridoxal phosphate-dependent protein
MTTAWNYEQLAQLVRGERMPLMVVDLDILDANTQRLSRVAKEHGKKLRVASKSVRVPELLKQIFKVGGDHFCGLMCFSTQEARLLRSEGFDDLLMAYPSVQASDLDVLWEMTQEGTVITHMIDESAHVEMLSQYWRERSGGSVVRPLRVCIDVDMSWRPWGLHLGVQRSPLRTVEDFRNVLEAVLRHPELKMSGVMGYEAQIAGLADQNPFAPLLNPAKKLIKWKSVTDVAAKRKQVAELLKGRGVRIEFFNGGHTINGLGTFDFLHQHLNWPKPADAH